MWRKVGKRISKRATQKLLEDDQWMADSTISLQSVIVYRHPDGRILSYFSESHGVLVEAKESQAYADMMRGIIKHYEKRIAEYPHGRHILGGRLPQGKDFPNQVSALLDELPELLNLSSTDCDFSNESLRQIAYRLKRRGREKRLEAPIFPAVVAYLGEMMRRQIEGGEWRMRLSDDGTVWEAWIVDDKGRICNPWLDLYDELNEGPIVLEGIPNHRVLSRKPAPPNFWNQENMS